jgi:hypothetical protein
MSVELRELMVYQSPPELGALYTEVEAMMKQMGKEQKVLITAQMKREEVQAKRRRARLAKLRHEFTIGVIVVIMIFFLGGVFMYVAYDRQRKYPQYGNGIFPKSEEQRRREAEPQVYIGR